MSKSTTPSTRNIMRVWRAATAEDIAAGREWYGRASRLAAELDPSDVERGAAVIAVISPLISWRVNVRIARQAYALAADGATADEIADALPMLKRNARKAAAILAGADPDLIVSGPKVRAFWRTIADPSDARGVVVDRHAFDIAVGRTMSDSERTGLLGKRGAYAATADAYVRAAKIVTRETGVPTTPADVQATTWLVWRATRAQANHGAGDAALIGA